MYSTSSSRGNQVDHKVASRTSPDLLFLYYLLPLILDILDREVTLISSPTAVASSFPLFFLLCFPSQRSQNFSSDRRSSCHRLVSYRLTKEAKPPPHRRRHSEGWCYHCIKTQPSLSPLLLNSFNLAPVLSTTLGSLPTHLSNKITRPQSSTSTNTSLPLHLPTASPPNNYTRERPSENVHQQIPNQPS